MLTVEDARNWTLKANRDMIMEISRIEDLITLAAKKGQWSIDMEDYKIDADIAGFLRARGFSVRLIQKKTVIAWSM